VESQEAKGALTALRNEGEVLNWQSSKERDQFLTVRREVGLDVRHDWRAPASRIRRAQRSTTPRSQASDRLLNQHSPPRLSLQPPLPRTLRPAEHNRPTILAAPLQQPHIDKAPCGAHLVLRAAATAQPIRA